MNLEDANEIIDCLPKGETPFWYFRDRYAVLLLSMLGASVTKRALKGSPFAQLLDKAVVKTVLAEHRGRAVPREALEYLVAASPETYSLTLTTWGGGRHNWVQTTRRGYSLVLQLNFPPEHDMAYRHLVDPGGRMPLVYYDHPVVENRRTTLAWARMDIDFEHNEALIEEIQTDWMRKARAMRTYADRARGKTVYFRGLRADKANIMRYCDEELSKHQHWDEAMLSAVLWFLRCELGVRTIFYHTHDSGAALKRTGDRKPPRSLYTRLPKRFCFRETTRRPAFMRGGMKTHCTKRAVADARFQVLEL
ncbi:MAG: hypothetical protein AAFV30_06605 [Pseudomonadota bacterium]